MANRENDINLYSLHIFQSYVDIQFICLIFHCLPQFLQNLPMTICSSQVTEEYKLNTAKRLQVLEKSWVKLASHFTILLSDRDTDLHTKIQVICCILLAGCHFRRNRSTHCYENKGNTKVMQKCGMWKHRDVIRTNEA